MIIECQIYFLDILYIKLKGLNVKNVQIRTGAGSEILKLRIENVMLKNIGD